MLVALALAMLCAVAVPVEAQPAAGKAPRLGYLWLGPRGSDTSTIEGLRRGLRELGYAEGQNVLFEYRYADGSLERLRQLAAELVRLDVAVILAPGTLVTAAVKQATTSIPVVSASGDPVGSGFVQSLARPGGNITGLSLSDDEGTAGKRLQLLKEALPRATRFGALAGPTSPLHRRIVGAQQEAARQLGVTLDLASVEGLADVPQAFTTLTRARVEAVVVAGSPALISLRREIVELAARNRLPTMYAARDYVDAGGLMTYSPSLPELWHRGAVYVDRILKGARPADLPVEQPTRFELVVNLKAAREIGLTLPQAFLLRADHVVE